MPAYNDDWLPHMRGAVDPPDPWDKHGVSEQDWEFIRLERADRRHEKWRIEAIGTLRSARRAEDRIRWKATQVRWPEYQQELKYLADSLAESRVRLAFDLKMAVSAEEDDPKPWNNVNFWQHRVAEQIGASLAKAYPGEGKGEYR